MLKLTGGTLVSPTIHQCHDLYITDGKMYQISQDSVTSCLDCTGLFILPGFVDQHVHGAMGIDCSDCTADQLQALSIELARHGVTGFLPTLTTLPKQHTLAALRGIAQSAAQMPGAAILGIHLEGPCLNEEYRGAQDPRNLALPAAKDFKAYVEAAGGLLRLVTLAPELDGAEELICYLTDLGIRVSIGHSSATFDQAQAAFSTGVGGVTHTLNGMRGFHQHEPSIFGAAILSNAMVEIICDGFHLVPPTVAVMEQVFGIERLILVTDAIPAAGFPDGEYNFSCFGEPLIITNGDARLKITDSRAGSTLTMDRAFRNFQQFTGRSMAEASRCASQNPLEYLGMTGRGKLADGMEADLTVLDHNQEVVYTIVGGRIVYARKGAGIHHV